MEYCKSFFLENPKKFTVDQFMRLSAERLESLSRTKKFKLIVKNIGPVSLESNMISIQIKTQLGNKIVVDIIINSENCRCTIKMNQKIHPKRFFVYKIREQIKKILGQP